MGTLQWRATCPQSCKRHNKKICFLQINNIEIINLYSIIFILDILKLHIGSMLREAKKDISAQPICVEILNITKYGNEHDWGLFNGEQLVPNYVKDIVNRSVGASRPTWYLYHILSSLYCYYKIKMLKKSMQIYFLTQ